MKSRWKLIKVSLLSNLGISLISCLICCFMYVSFLVGFWLFILLWFFGGPVAGILLAAYLMWYGSKIRRALLLFLIHAGTGLVLLAVRFLLPKMPFYGDLIPLGNVYMAIMATYIICFTAVSAVTALVMLIRKAVHMVRKKRGGKNAED